MTRICKLSLLMLIPLALFSCRRSDYIREDQSGFIGFRFFLFAQFGEEKVQANGDAALLKDDYFAFRLFDNLLNQYVMFYSSQSEGRQTLVLPLNKVEYTKFDLELSQILIKSLYPLLKGELINSEKDDTIKQLLLENNEIKAIIFTYGEWDLRLEVLKRMENGLPARIRIINGDNSLIFDIIEYHPYSFSITQGQSYKHYTVRGDQPFLDWIGEVYGRQ